MAVVFVFFVKRLTGLVEHCCYLLFARFFTFPAASLPPAKFEPEIQASERGQTDALDRAANGSGKSKYCFYKTR
jgi:hypothetical protein